MARVVAVNIQDAVVNGSFEMPVVSDPWLRPERGPLDLILAGRHSDAIPGWLTRLPSGDSLPRVLGGGLLQDYFQRSWVVSSSDAAYATTEVLIAVEILTPSILRIGAPGLLDCYSSGQLENPEVLEKHLS
jgi:hypothetical protein